MTYEQKIMELEGIVAKLESGEVPLAQLVSLYEQGQALAAQCQKELDDAVQRMQQLQNAEEAGQ